MLQILCSSVRINLLKTVHVLKGLTGIVVTCPFLCCSEPAPTRAPMVKTHVMPDSADMFNREQQRPPKFKFPIKPLLDLTETQKAHFESRLVPVGDPNMEVEWYKDEQMLRAGEAFWLFFCLNLTKSKKNVLHIFLPN